MCRFVSRYFAISIWRRRSAIENPARLFLYLRGLELKMSTFVRWVAYFSSGLLGIWACLFAGSWSSHRIPGEMGEPFKYFFVSLIWMPIGGFISVCATALTRHRAAFTFLVGFFAGIALFSGTVLGAKSGSRLLAYSLPFVCYFAVVLISNSTWKSETGNRTGNSGTRDGKSGTATCL